VTRQLYSSLAHKRIATRLGAIAAAAAAAKRTWQVLLQQSKVATRSGDCGQRCHERTVSPIRLLNALLLHFNAALKLQLLYIQRKLEACYTALCRCATAAAALLFVCVALRSSLCMLSRMRAFSSQQRKRV
jgi:hypothetical protein